MKYKAYTLYNFKEIPQLKKLSDIEKRSIEIVSQVLPFKTNNYVIKELIDWSNYRNDPMYILNFPQQEMLNENHFQTIESLTEGNYKKNGLQNAINQIRMELNPHPAGQMEFNVPKIGEMELNGIQHKYNETMLFFPSQGQTCHAYCTFCFRWPQFTGISNLKFAMKQSKLVVKYLKEHPEITDILITGGDPMVMKATILEKYIDALLNSNIPHLQTIRIGTKSLSFWPYRYITDKDSDDILRIFEKISSSGKHLAFMTHLNHYRELETKAVEYAIKRIRDTGAEIRSQSPVLKHINDDPQVWAKMWKKQVNLGIIPYYMFIARETGAQEYFAVPLVKAYEIFKNAYSQTSGICRTVRGPSMSANPGKIVILGFPEINKNKTIALSFIQGRDPNWVLKPFFAKYNENAYWITDLEPFEGSSFFYEQSLEKILSAS